MSKSKEANQFDDLLLNIAQFESIQHELMLNSNRNVYLDTAVLFAEAEVLKSKIRKYFNEMNQKLFTLRDQAKIDSIKRKFSALVVWFNANTKKKYIVSQFSDYPTQIEKSLNYDDQASINESFFKEDSKPLDTQIVKDISNEFKNLSVNKSVQIDEADNKNLNRVTRSKRVASLNRMPKLPRRQNKRNKSLVKGLKEPVVFFKNDKSKLMQRGDFNHNLLHTQIGKTDEISKEINSTDSKLKLKTNSKFKVVHLDTEIVINEMQNPCLKLHLVRDNELISLSKYPTNLWDNFSNENFKRMFSNDFF